MGGKEKKHASNGDGLSKEQWKANLAEVNVRRGRTVYRPNKKVELPALLQTQVIASRDPRLSPSLPNSSVYSRDFDIEDDGGGYGFEDDASGSFNSEDWYMDEVSGDFEEEAKTFKVKVHVNPKFLGKEDEVSKVNVKAEADSATKKNQEGTSKEKVKSWLQESVEEKPAERASKRHENKSPVRAKKERVKEEPAVDSQKINLKDPQKSIAMFPDESAPKVDLTPMFTGSLFPHIQPLKTKDFGKKWESRESEKSKAESRTPQSPVRDQFESRRPLSPPKEFSDNKLSAIRDIPSEMASSAPRSRTRTPQSRYSRRGSVSPSSSRHRSPAAQSRKSHSSVRSPSPQLPPRIMSPARRPSPFSSTPQPAPIPIAQRLMPEPVPASEQWTNRAPPQQPPHSVCCLRPLSGYAKRSSDCLRARPTIVDRLFDSHRRDVFNELDHVCRGRKQSKYDKAWAHFPQLSMETQLESTFAESAMVKRVYLATLREWMSTKPLENLIVNQRGTENTEKPLPIRSSIKTDATLKQCMDQFDAELYHMSKGGKEVERHQDNVYPMPVNATEETVDEVYRQVHQYMDFLNKKAVSGQVSERPKVELLSPIQSSSKPVQPVPEPVQVPLISTDECKTEQEHASPQVAESLAYSPSRPTGLDEEDDDNESEISKKRKADSHASPSSKKHKSDEKKNKKKEKKHKKDKKKDKAKKAKKKRKERRNTYNDEEDDEAVDGGQREEPKSGDSDTSGSESPPSTRHFSETIESPTKEEFKQPKFRESKFSESKDRWSTDHHEERRSEKYDERRDEGRYSDRSDRQEGRFDDRRRRDEERYEDQHDDNRFEDKHGDRDRKDDEHDRERGHELSGGRGFRGRGYRQTDAFLLRRWQRERKLKMTNVMHRSLENLLSMKQQEETVLDTTIATWKMFKDITHTEASYVTKHLVDAVKHLSRDFDPEKGFNWALILAIHSQVMQDAQDRLALEEATAAAAKAEQELEEGEIDESPVHDSSKDETIPKAKEEVSTKSKPSTSKAGGLGNKLLTAFRQQMAAKKREELGIVNKVEVAKLSPAAAAKKPKPSSSRPLFKPPAAFEMLKAAQEERERQRQPRSKAADGKEELRFDGVVREGLIADALKSFFHLTEDVLQLAHTELAADFIEFVMPAALETVNVVKKFLGLAATIVIIVKEKREKDKQRTGGKKAEYMDDSKDSDDEKFQGEIKSLNDDSMKSEPTDSDVKSEQESKRKKGDAPSEQDDTTVVDMDMDDEEDASSNTKVNEYGTVVNEYGTVVEQDDVPKLKTPIKLTGTPKLIRPKGSVATALDDEDMGVAKRKLEMLSDDEESTPKKAKGAETSKSVGKEEAVISKDKMEGVEKIEFEDADSSVLQQRLQRMQTGGASSNRQVVAERINAIVSEGPNDDSTEATTKDEDGTLVFQKFTPVNGSPQQKKTEDVKEEAKKAVVESVIAVKGKPTSPAVAAPLPKPTTPKTFKSKGWGSAPKASCTSTQKVSAQDILARLQSKAAQSAGEEQKPQEQAESETDASKMETDDLYQTALTTCTSENVESIPSPPKPPEEPLPPLPPTDAKEPPPLPAPPLPTPLLPTPPLPTEFPAMEPPPIPKLITAKSAEEFSAASSSATGVVAQAGPRISKPVAFPPLPDTSQPPPSFSGEATSFPGKFQQYPPPEDKGQFSGAWGDYGNAGYNYNNQRWDGTQWVSGGAGTASWPPPTWQPPPPTAPPGSGAWPAPPAPTTTASAAPSWPAWPPPTHGPPPPGPWGWQQQQQQQQQIPQTTSSVVSSSNVEAITSAPPPAVSAHKQQQQHQQDWSDLPPGEDPPVPQVWPTASSWKQPRPPGTSDPAPPGDDGHPPPVSSGGSMADAPLNFKKPPLPPSTPKAKPKPEWKKPPFPIRPVLPLPSHMRVYVFNREKLMNKNVDAFLTEMAVEKFDPHNLSCLQYLKGVEAAAVLIHQDDCDKLHHIPNLYKLKKQPEVKFVTYFDANDVAMQKYSLVLPSGGMLVADDTVLLGLQPAALKELCRYMLTAGKAGKDPASWSLVIHAHIAAKLNMRKHELSNTSTEVLRITSLLETIEHFRNEGVVDVLHNHGCHPPSDKPAHEYLTCCIKLQAERADKHRHVFLLSDVRMTSEKSAQFMEAGVGIISVPDFLQKFAGKSTPAPMVAIPRPMYPGGWWTRGNPGNNHHPGLRGYGKRGAAMFDDLPLSTGTQELDLEKIPPETFHALGALTPIPPPPLPPSTATTTAAAAARLGEVIRPDANVRPSPGRYDAGTVGPGRGGWMQDDKPPGV